MGMFGFKGQQPANPFAQAAADAASAIPNIFREAVPAHMRIFASTLAGDRSPITEKNYSPAELAALRALIDRNQRYPFYKTGAVTYGDYTQSGSMGTSNVSRDGRAHVGPVKGGFDFGNPQLNALGNSVGQFRYRTLPDGRTVIDDSYDWDSGRPDGGPQSGRASLIDALSSVLATGSLEQLGAWAAPDEAHGRPVHIELPPVRKK